MSNQVKIPAFYLTRKWQDSIGKTSFSKRIQERIDEIERKLPNMSLQDRQNLWKTEPCWEVSELIIKSKDFTFPK